MDLNREALMRGATLDTVLFYSKAIMVASRFETAINLTSNNREDE